MSVMLTIIIDGDEVAVSTSQQAEKPVGPFELARVQRREKLRELRDEPLTAAGSIMSDQRRAMFGLLTKLNGGEPLTDEQRRRLAKSWVGVSSWRDLSEAQASTILAGLFALDGVLNR